MGVPRSSKRRDKQYSGLYELRMKKMISQRELADRAGISRNALMRIENGDSAPNMETCRKLCTALNIELSELFK